MQKMNIKTGDQVKVLSGKDKGVTAKVLRALPNEHKVVVEGVAVVKKALRPTQANQQGGISQQEAPIDVSNVQVICPSCQKPTRVGHQDNNGKKERVCKKCGKSF